MRKKSKNENKWFLVYTKPNQEVLAKENLENQGYDSFLPIINYIEEGDLVCVSREVLFPRYLFIRINRDMQNWTSVRSTRGVSHLVSFGDRLAEVPIDLIEKLLKMTDDNGNFPHILTKRSLKKGEDVLIDHGLFKNKKGTFIDYIRKDRARILIDVMSNKIPVEILISSIASRIPKNKI